VDDAFDVRSSQVPICSRSYSEERMTFDLRIVRSVICDEKDGIAKNEDVDVREY
jgi:hypothetical protein